MLVIDERERTVVRSIDCVLLKRDQPHDFIGFNIETNSCAYSRTNDQMASSVFGDLLFEMVSSRANQMPNNICEPIGNSLDGHYSYSLTLRI